MNVTDTETLSCFDLTALHKSQLAERHHPKATENFLSRTLDFKDIMLTKRLSNRIAKDD